MTIDPRVTQLDGYYGGLAWTNYPNSSMFLRATCRSSDRGRQSRMKWMVTRHGIEARILEAKPGITGLWQVNGRSRVTFDEMVRLDLTYARTWSLWLDIKILLQTPERCSAVTVHINQFALAHQRSIVYHGHQNYPVAHMSVMTTPFICQHLTPNPQRPSDRPTTWATLRNP